MAQHRAADTGHGSEAGGCYACVLPCGAFAVSAVAGVGALVYFGLRLLHLF